MDERDDFREKEREIESKRINMVIARDASWLCALLQDAKFNAKQKQQFISYLVSDHCK